MIFSVLRQRAHISLILMRSLQILLLLAVFPFMDRAEAQTYDFSPPFVELDENGVDISGGGFVFDMPETAIGTGTATLALRNTIRARGTDYALFWKDNFSGMLTTSDAPDAGTLTPVEYDGQYTVFQVANGQYSRGAVQNGTALIAGPNKDYFTYKLRDGREVRFDHYLPYNGSQANLCYALVIANPNAPITTCRYYPTIVKYPNGVTHTLSYTLLSKCSNQSQPSSCAYVARISSVATNFGARADYVYASDQSTPNDLSWQIKIAVKLYQADDPSTVQTVAYNYPSANVLTITLPGSRTWKFVTTDTTNLDDGTPLRPITSIESPDLLNGKISITYNSGLCNPGDCDDFNYYGTVKTVNRGRGVFKYVKTFSEEGVKTTVTNAFGNQKIFTAPNSVANFLPPRPTSVQDELGAITKYVYDEYQRTKSVTSPEGVETQFEYDDLSNVTVVTTKPRPGSNLPNLVRRREFPSSCVVYILCFQPLYEIDPNLNRTDYSYDQSNGLIKSVSAPAAVAGGVRPVTTYFYDTIGGVAVVSKISRCRYNASCDGTADEVVTKTQYNGRLYPISEAETGNGVLAETKKTYDSVGNLVAIDGPLSGDSDTTSYRYNAARQVTGVISADPDGAGPLPRPAIRNVYNAVGLLTESQTGTVTDLSDASWATFQASITDRYLFDVFGRTALRAKAIGATNYNVTQFSYDALGRLECTAVRMNTVAFNPLPAVLTPACSQAALGDQGPDRITRNVYDAVGRLTQIRRAVGTGLEQAYSNFTYSPDGNRQTISDANGNLAAYTYDGFGRTIAWAFPSQVNGAGTAPCTIGAVIEVNGVAGPSAAPTSGDDCEKYSYDRNGNRVRMMKRDGRTLNYFYDALNRVTEKQVGGACVSGFSCAPPPSWAVRNIFYSYDLLGHQTEAHFDSTNGPDAVINAYDALGRITSSTVSMGGVSRVVATQYDAASRRTRVIHPDGNAFAYGYDVLDRLAAISEVQVSTPTISTQIVNNSYNYLGQIFMEARGSVLTQYDYDGLYRLSHITDNLSGFATDVTQHFDYNAVNQIISRDRDNVSYAYGSYGVEDKNYTVNGLNQYVAVGNGTISYDSSGNLSENGPTKFTYDVENRLVAAAGGLSTNMVYDPMGRLYETFSGSTVRQFLYDGDERIAEYDGNTGAMLRRYVHGNGNDDPVIWYEGPGFGDRRSLQADEQGSIISVADAFGAAMAIKSYDEYGVPSGGDVGAFQYTGQTWLPDLGMYYYKARIYSSKLGRFLQTDPIGYADHNNLYAYVGNDPRNGADPTGTECDPKPCPIAPGGPFAGKPIDVTELTQQGEPGDVAGILANGGYYTGSKEHPTWHSNAMEAAQKLAAAAALTLGGELLGPAVAGVRAIGGLGRVTEAAVPAAEAAVPQVTANRIAGNAFRDELAESLRLAGRDVSTEVYKRTPFGPRYIDIEVSSGGKVLGGIETKVGNSRYTPAQRTKDWWLKINDNYIVTVVRKK